MAWCICQIFLGDQSEDEAVKSFSKGQEVEAVILGIDPHKERISLGIKQLSEDVFDTFAKIIQKELSYLAQ